MSVYSWKILDNKTALPVRGALIRVFSAANDSITVFIDTYHTNHPFQSEVLVDTSGLFTMETVDPDMRFLVYKEGYQPVLYVPALDTSLGINDTLTIFLDPTESHTVFDNFGNNWSFTYSGGWSISGPYSDNIFEQQVACRFQPFDTGIVTDVWIPISHSPFNRAKNAHVLLAKDSIGRPGPVLEQWVVGNDKLLGQTTAPFHLGGNRLTKLYGGQKYWLWAMADDSSFFAWNWTNPRQLSLLTVKEGSNPWSTPSNGDAGAFRIDIKSVSQ